MIAVSSTSLYFFKAYAKGNQIENADCTGWEPILLEDRIPVSRVNAFLVTGYPKMLYMIVTPEKGSLFSFGGPKPVVKIVIFHEFRGKDTILTALFEQQRFTESFEPIYNTFITDKVPNSDLMQIVSVSISPPVPRKSLFDGRPRLQNMTMLVITRGELRFFPVNFSKWRYVDSPRPNPKVDDEAAGNPAVLLSRELALKQQGIEAVRVLSH
jgi:hypothetical protein